MFFPTFGIGRAGGGGGGHSPKGLVHNLLMQTFTLGCCKMKVFETHILIPSLTKMTIQV